MPTMGKAISRSEYLLHCLEKILGNIGINDK